MQYNFYNIREKILKTWWQFIIVYRRICCQSAMARVSGYLKTKKNAPRDLEMPVTSLSVINRKSFRKFLTALVTYLSN